MVKFGVDTVEEAMPLAEDAARRVSDIFPNPIKLEFEKVYFPYLLMNKKRYAGLLWTRPEKYDKLDSKGLETVRRDNCLLVRAWWSLLLRKILIERNVSGAIDYTKHIISELLQKPHRHLAARDHQGTQEDGRSGRLQGQAGTHRARERMRKRDSGSAPALGERIAYVIVTKGKAAPLYEKARIRCNALRTTRADRLRLLPEAAAAEPTGAHLRADHRVEQGQVRSAQRRARRASAPSQG
ncbi:hypothetical protein PINS_up023651 [Pythium insidiosum]|nr:hypothetical protein PINS_up023651 [Pythium insidiosum]